VVINDLDVVGIAISPDQAQSSLTGRSAKDMRDYLAQLSSLGVLARDADDRASVP